MIVRVMGDGQYEVDDDLLHRVNALDREAIAAVERDDEATLDGLLDQMGALVRDNGTRLPDSALMASTLVIPASDLSLAESRKLLSEQGFIPDPPTSAA